MLEDSTLSLVLQLPARRSWPCACQAHWRLKTIMVSSWDLPGFLSTIFTALSYCQPSIRSCSSRAFSMREQLNGPQSDSWSSRQLSCKLRRNIVRPWDCETVRARVEYCQTEFDTSTGVSELFDKSPWWQAVVAIVPRSNQKSVEALDSDVREWVRDRLQPYKETPSCRWI